MAQKLAKRARIATWTLVCLVGLVTASGMAAAGNGWGNDRVADWNDAQCDDDEGTGNDAKCEGGDDGASGGSGGHGWGNDRVADENDAQCDDDEGTGNDWKCTGASRK